MSLQFNPGNNESLLPIYSPSSHLFYIVNNIILFIPCAAMMSSPPDFCCCCWISTNYTYLLSRLIFLTFDGFWKKQILIFLQLLLQRIILTFIRFFSEPPHSSQYKRLKLCYVWKELKCITMCINDKKIWKWIWEKKQNPFGLPENESCVAKAYQMITKPSSTPKHHSPTIPVLNLIQQPQKLNLPKPGKLT